MKATNALLCRPHCKHNIQKSTAWEKRSCLNCVLLTNTLVIVTAICEGGFAFNVVNDIEYGTPKAPSV